VKNDDTPSTPKGLEWPIGIAAGLLVVVLVNVGFIVIATSNAPIIEASYETVDR